MHTVSSSTIAIYYTRENGEHVIDDKIRSILSLQSLTHGMCTEFVTPAMIKNGILHRADVVGFVMPGRNRGQDYRDELDKIGFHHIQQSVLQGVNFFGICAGAYVVSAKTRWHSKYGGQSLTNTSPAPLFQGICEGAIHELWKHGYLEDIGEQVFDTLLHRESYLPASVVRVGAPEAFNADSDFAVMYGGGGRFLPDDKQQMRVLLKHRQTDDQTPAVVECDLGLGKVMLSNVHPEASRAQMDAGLRSSALAMANPLAFRADLHRLEAGRLGQKAIFQRFIQNCRQSVKAGQQAPAQHTHPLANPMPIG